jgi:hypothetical protein
MKNFAFGDFIYDKNRNSESWTLTQLNPMCKSTEIIIPRSVLVGRVSAIGNNAFANNRKLESVTVPFSLDTIGESAFRDCSALHEIVFSPTNTCLNIDKNAFEDCKKLRHVYFHRPVKLCSKAFYGCDNIQIVDGKMQYVGRMAFSSCKNLTEISFDLDVEIADSAFAFCRQLNTLKFHRNIIGSLDFMEHVPKTARIVCRDDSKLTELSYLGYNVQTYYEVP